MPDAMVWAKRLHDADLEAGFPTGRHVPLLHAFAGHESMKMAGQEHSTKSPHTWRKLEQIL